MRCNHCGREVPDVKKTCPYCGSFMVGCTANNVTGEYGYRDENGMFHSCKDKQSKKNCQNMKSIWIARDGDGRLFAHESKPVRSDLADNWVSHASFCCRMRDYWFPEVAWESEPIELVIKEKEDKQ